MMESSESTRRAFFSAGKNARRKAYYGMRTSKGKGKSKCPACGFKVRGPNHDCKRVTSHAGK